MSLDAVSDIAVEGVIKKNKKLYVFVIQVEWKDGVIIEVYRSYNEILTLQEKLLKSEEFLLYLKNEFAENRTGYLLQDKTLFGKFGIKKQNKAMKKMREVEEFLKSVVHLPSMISTSDDVIELFRPVPDDMFLEINEYKSYSMKVDSKGTRRSGYALNISEPILLEQYVAVCDYSKTHGNDLNLKAGNIVEVIHMGEHGWWFVDLDGDLGWVPASYLDPRDGDDMNERVMEVFADGEEEIYIAMGIFKPEADDEVALEVGKIVQVKQKNVDGWWLVRCDGCTGWAPCINLRALSSSRGSYTRQIEREAAMMTMKNIFAITDRRTTWNPAMPIKHTTTMRKATVRRRYGNNPDDEEKPSYVNIEFKAGSEEGEDADSDEEDIPSYINVDFSPYGNKKPKKRSRGKKKEQKGSSYMNMDFHKKNDKSPAIRTRRRREEDGDLLEIDFSKMKMSTEKYENKIKESETEIKTMKKRKPGETVPEGVQETSSDDASKPGPTEIPKIEEVDNTPSIHDVCKPGPTEIPKIEEIADTPPIPARRNEEPSNKHQSHSKENKSTAQHVQAADRSGSNSVRNGEDNVFLSIGDYTKDADTEVDLREGKSVEVLEQTEGGWWLVRNQDLAIGWAPSNFLEKIIPKELKRRKEMGLEPPERPPLRPPKTSKVYKQARAITTEKKFWSFVGKNGKNAACSIGDSIDMNYFSEEPRPSHVEHMTTADISCDFEYGVYKIDNESTRF